MDIVFVSAQLTVSSWFEGQFENHSFYAGRKQSKIGIQLPKANTHTTLIDTYCYCWVDFLSYVSVVINTFIRLRHIFSPSLQLSFFFRKHRATFNDIDI